MNIFVTKRDMEIILLLSYFNLEDQGSIFTFDLFFSGSTCHAFSVTLVF